MPQSFADSMREFFHIVTESLSMPGVLFLCAVSPAICEEAAFRGVILSGLKGKLARWQTVVVVGLLFGFFHLSIYRLAPTALLGMLITFAVLQTRSILSGILIHFGVNAMVFATGIYPSLGAAVGLSERGIENGLPVAGFGVVLVAGLLLLPRKPS
jgi:membrane protease YdiL (CAAX protease family)